jgi:hypothetical protein
MDDEAVFGKVLYSLPFPKAIQRGLLTDYRVVIIGVDDPTIAEWIKNREIVKPKEGEETDAESLASQIGMLKAIKDYDLKRVISFHSRVKRAEEFSNDIQDVLGWVEDQHKPSGNLWSDYVSGAMPTNKRKQKLDRLKAITENQRGILTNARCLSEGVDLPSLDGVAFIDPKNSQVDIIQAVGRAIRLSADKKFGTIVLPVFIKQGEDAIASIEASNFKPVWDILNALKSHDEELAYELDQLRTEMGKRSGTKIGADAFSKITIDLPATIDASFGDSLRTYLVEQTTASWNFWFGLLREYIESNGHCQVPQRYRCKEGYQLGHWLGWQRKNKKILPQAKKTLLENLVGWTWDPLGDQWDNGLSHLQVFIEKHGHCGVPKGYQAEDGFRLDSWVGTQRNTYDVLTQVRRGRLEAIDGWTWDVLDTRWEECFKQLQEFASEHGHCNAPRNYRTRSGIKLALWIATQRKKNSEITESRRKRLEALPSWSWDPIGDLWEKGFAHLLVFIDEFGHGLVPSNYISADGYKLGQWVGTQRRNCSVMPDDFRTRLKSLRGWSWDTIDDRWEFGFSHLVEYERSYGHCKVPALYRSPDGYRIGQWVMVQRSSKDDLSMERKMRLELLQDWCWDVANNLWEEGFRRLKEFSQQHQHCNVPTKFMTDGYKLGQWVGVQRRRRDKLIAEKIQSLESLVGWCWDPLAALWDSGFRHLSNFVDEHGHCIVPSAYCCADGFKLGRWVSTQRERSKKGKTPKDRIARLELLPGWVWRVDGVVSLRCR